MKILAHLCCAPCSCYTVPKLRDAGHEVHGYFYNPNIHPYTEYMKRKEAMEQYAAAMDLPMNYGEYALDDYLRKVVYKENERCAECYRLRLRNTAYAARKGKFDAFTTTLLYSKYQKHELIKEIALSLANEYNLEFYYEDFRDGWKEGIDISREMQLYRQQYCGCIYSELERYSEKKS